MKFQSHTPKELLLAIDSGEVAEVYMLSTGNDGEDDVLIGSSKEEVLSDICNHYEFQKLPEHWTLEKVSREVIEDYA